MANCDCNNNSEEKVLTESGFRHIIEKLSGKLLLAIGTIKAKGESPLHLWQKYSDTGVIIHGKVDEATSESSGVMSAEDKQRLDELWQKYQAGELGGKGVTVTYEQPVITKFSYEDIPAEGGAVLPTIEFTQGWSDSEGNSGTLTQDDTDFEVTYKPQETFSGGSINTETGAVTRNAENESTERILVANLQVFVTANGMESDPVFHNIYQAGAELKYTYSTPTVNVMYDNLPNEIGATIEPKNWYVTQTRTGNDGSSEPIILTDGFEKSFNAYDSGGLQNAELNEETGVITCTALNEKEEEIVIGVVNVHVVANGKSGTTKINIYQEAGEQKYSYSEPTVTLTYNTALAKHTSLTPTLSYRQTKTDSDGNTETITSGGVVKYSLSQGASGVNINEETGELTFPENTSSSQITLGVVSVSVELNGQTGTASASTYQSAPPLADPETNVECLDYTDNVALRSLDKGPYASIGDELQTFQGSSGGHLYAYNISGFKTVDIYSASVPPLLNVVPFVAQDELFDLDAIKNGKGVITIDEPWGYVGHAGSYGETEGVESGLYINGALASNTQPNESTPLQVSSLDTNGKKYLYVLRYYTGSASEYMPRVVAHNFTAPVVAMDEEIYSEQAGSGTQRIYFNVDITTNDASIVLPSYFESGGVKYDVEQETAKHTDATGNEISTGYAVTLPYNGDGAFGSSRLYCVYEVHTSDGDYNGEVASTNVLVNNNGTFYVRQ